MLVGPAPAIAASNAVYMVYLKHICQPTEESRTGETLVMATDLYFMFLSFAPQKSRISHTLDKNKIKENMYRV